MGKMRKSFVLLFASALILTCFVNLPVKAAEEKYTYTIRFFAGQQGSFVDSQSVVTLDDYDVEGLNVELNSDGVLICSGLRLGDTVKFNLDSVELNNGSKYYVKGIRESGKDNNTVGALSFTVESDMDYVVAYGLRGNMVAYTVSYVDRGGNELAPPDTYYGNVGDKPVVAYLYIDGYLPQTYNLTKTLDEDASKNAFRFIYTSLEGTQIDETVTSSVLPGTDGGTTVEVIPGTTTVIEGDGQNAGGGAAGGQNADGVELTEPQVPLGTIDLDNMTEDGVYLDDPSVPLGDMKFQLGPIEVDARRLVVTLVILIAVAAIAIASFWFWKPLRKKEKDNEEDVTRSV